MKTSTPVFRHSQTNLWREVNFLFILPFILFVITTSTTVLAMDIGVGTSSVTSGRQIPALAVAFNSNNYTFSLSSTGTASKLTYFSGYTAGLYNRSKIGDFVGGDLEAGFGLAGFYTKRGFRETTTSSVEEVVDQGAGPGFRIVWLPADFFFASLEAVYGMSTRPTNMVFLSSQDIVVFAIGFRF